MQRETVAASPSGSRDDWWHARNTLNLSPARTSLRSRSPACALSGSKVQGIGPVRHRKVSQAEEQAAEKQAAARRSNSLQGRGGERGTCNHGLGRVGTEVLGNARPSPGDIDTHTQRAREKKREIETGRGHGERRHKRRCQEERNTAGGL
jgi:hypothetical protein